MYTRCLFCTGDLGRNEAVEAFPVGRRLAYDAVKGRLWVVCPRCGRWNLTPLEERWEAIEQAERLFRGTRLRASTDNVGLGRVSDGTDLVRVGAPLRPEIAAWRYGAAFRRRRVRAVAFTAARESLLGALALATGNWLLIAQSVRRVGRHLSGEAAVDRLDAAVGVDAPVTFGARVLTLAVSSPDVDVVSLDDGRVTAEVKFGHTRRVLDPVDGHRVLEALLVRVNGHGAASAEVSDAVARLVAAGDAAAFVRKAATRTRRARASAGQRGAESPTTGLNALVAGDRLTLEMALHEERERRALDGELIELERAWQEAERIAAIADELTLPARVQHAFARLRAGAGRSG